nr:MAG TPA: hypothetical protein [Caudoviricetes sp.]
MSDEYANELTAFLVRAVICVVSRSCQPSFQSLQGFATQLQQHQRTHHLKQSSLATQYSLNLLPACLYIRISQVQDKHQQCLFVICRILKSISHHQLT